MKFNKALNERAIPIISNSPLAKRLRDYRGVHVIVLGEKEPPDVHGIPKDMEAYGRGWFNKNGSISIDGGATGSREGHPSYAIDGFYWGYDLDAKWRGSDGEIRKGIIYVRGRAGTNEQMLEDNLTKILNLIFKRLPKPI